jgi:hypothetical protein
VFTTVWAGAKMPGWSGRVAELADAKDLGSFGVILAGSTPVAPTPEYFSWQQEVEGVWMARSLKRMD